MPWRDCTAVDERKAFVTAVSRGEQSFSALCRYFNIYRPTGHKWLERFAQSGPDGLADQSRAPLHRPNTSSRRFIDDHSPKVFAA